MHFCEQKSEIWLQRRSKRLTASQIATALNLNPYQTRTSLLQQYAGVGIGCKQQFTGNEATRHGEKYEDEAIDKYEKREKTVVLHFGLMPFLGSIGSFLGGSVDGVTVNGVLVEVKCPYRRRPKLGMVPTHYAPQVQSMLHGFKLTRADFVEFVPMCMWKPEVFYVTRMDRDEEFWTANYAQLLEFWHRVTLCRRSADACVFLQNQIDLESLKRPKKRARVRQQCQVVVPSSNTGLT